MGLLYDVLAEWQARALHVRGKAFDGGHWLPEQFPEEVSEELISFFK